MRNYYSNPRTKASYVRKSRPSAVETLARKSLKSMRRKKASAAKNQSKIMTLTKQVKKLQVAEFGQKQIMRQQARSFNGLPAGQIARVSAKFPICFCHQAIDTGNEIFQVELDAITSAIITEPIGAFGQQPFPLLSTDAGSQQFNQLKYLQQNSLGIQPGYLHLNTSYDLYFNAVNWRGWADVLLVSPRAQYTRQSAPQTDDFQLPSGLPGFSYTCGGTPIQWNWNPLMFGVKRLKRMYFNTSPDYNGEDFPQLHTNPDRYCRLKVRNSKHKSHIRAQKPANQVTQAITHLDIPFNQQDWIVITSSDISAATSDSYLAVNISKCVTWRDSFGSS